MAALRLDGIFPEINETGIMPGLFEMEGQIGIVFQGSVLDKQLTVKENLESRALYPRCRSIFRITLSAIVLRR